MISFVHLSDIHFLKTSGDALDVDSDLRNEILRDIKNNFNFPIDSVKGILVCGDIAFSGKENEYEIASKFLNDICDELKIEKSCVFCVPGNHDIDQDVPKKSPAVKFLQDNLARAKDQGEYDSLFANCCRDKQSRDSLYATLDTYYHSFAEQYNCIALAPEVNWEQQIRMSDKYVLRIVGINSTTISNADDHNQKQEGDRLMRIGTVQVPMRADATIILTLCHHPPDCWKDPNGVIAAALNSRVSLQLYGHKHVQAIKENKTSLMICSGATHPSRSDDEWLPRYNWVSLDVEEKRGVDYLKIMVNSRVYDTNTSQFVADAELCPSNRVHVFYMPIGEKNKSDHLTSIEKPVDDNSNSKIKEFAYGFMNLSYCQRGKLLSDFNLINDTDEGKKHAEMIQDILNRAREKGITDELFETVKKMGGKIND